MLGLGVEARRRVASRDDLQEETDGGRWPARKDMAGSMATDWRRRAMTA
jgi:hypothetical protein